MTKDEFIQRYRAQQKHGNGCALLWLLLFFVILITNAFYAKHIDGQPKHVQIIYGVAFFGFLLVQLPLLTWYLRRETRQFGLRCPSCDKPLVGVSAQIAIASGNCGHCGTKLFTDDVQRNG